MPCVSHGMNSAPYDSFIEHTDVTTFNKPYTVADGDISPEMLHKYLSLAMKNAHDNGIFDVLYNDGAGMGQTKSVSFEKVTGGYAFT